MSNRLPLLLTALAVAPAAAAAQAVPTPQQLGVPIYPGAHYEAQMSTGMSQPTEKYYVFTTADSLRRVVAFYENATKKQGTPMGVGGAVLIVLEGQAPFPRHGVMIEPNRPGMYPPSVRTVFTVRREIAPEEPRPDTSAAKPDTSALQPDGTRQ